MRPVVLILLFALTACGFRPLYAPADPGLARVELASIPERTGQQLRLLLTDRFYAARPSQSPEWILAIRLENYREDLGLSRNDVATRARRTVIAHFTLTPIGQTTPVLSGSERSFTSYDVYADPFATSAAEDNAQTRGLTQLADLLTNRIAVYLASHPASGSVP